MRDRDLECVQTRKEKIFMSTLSRKLNRLFKENAKLRKNIWGWSTNWTKRNWEQRYAVIALYATNRELESQRLELYQANQWADQDQVQREKIHSCGELGMRNRIFEESRARCCQEIKDLWRSCCEETDRARQLRKLMDCLGNRKRILLQWISFWLRFKTCKMRWMLWTRRKNFTIRKQRAALRVYSRKRFWKPTCSRRTILSSLREFTEFGIIFLQIGTR